LCSSWVRRPSRYTLPVSVLTCSWMRSMSSVASGAFATFSPAVRCSPTTCLLPPPRQVESPAYMSRGVELRHSTTSDFFQIHNLYGVIFHWIEHEALRPLLCNLLYRMTRPQDVLTWRVHRLYPYSHSPLTPTAPHNRLALALTRARAHTHTHRRTLHARHARFEVHSNHQVSLTPMHM
jgi:hypothetical protein